MEQFEDLGDLTLIVCSVLSLDGYRIIFCSMVLCLSLISNLVFIRLISAFPPE